MKYIYKTTKVVYDAHRKAYEVYYKTWFFWHYDSCFQYDENSSRAVHYCNKETAETRAIARASGMLDSQLIWQQSSFLGR